MTIKAFTVEGMACKNCKALIEKGLKNITGINDVKADLDNNQVWVSGDEIDNLKVKQSIEESGYVFKGEIDLDTDKSSSVWFG